MRSIFLVAVVTLCAGCAGRTDYFVSDTNYLTYDHPFTDAATEAARKSAERNCAERKQMVIETRRACSLTRCTTHFQCIDKAGAARSRQDGGKK